MSSLLSGFHNLPPVAHESGGGFPASQAPGGDFKQLLSRAISALDATKAASDDPEDTAAIAKCISALHGIQAAEQKELHSALGMSSQQKLIAKHKRSQGGY